jgi:hypothetical protein
MWNCPKCRERVEDLFEVCWNCGTSREGVEDPNFRKVEDMGPSPEFARPIAVGQPLEVRPPAPHPPAPRPRASIDDLIFVGLNGYALALDRDTGDIVWENRKMRSGYVSLLLDGDRLIVSTNGYMYCLDPRDGSILWHNPLSGFGTSPTAVISRRGQSSSLLAQQAADRDTESSTAIVPANLASI